MFAFAGFLRQFRGGVPGAPVPAGVPVDRRAELAAELAPVLTRLEGAQHEAGAIVAAAQAEAGRRAVATDAAAQLVAHARASAAAEQRRAALEHVADTEAQCNALLAAAAAEAERIDRAAQERIPSLVTELAARLLDRSR